MAVLGVKLNPQSSSLANFVWFAPFFPWHLHTFHTFCFMNDVIITLNRIDSSHYVKLLYKGKVAYGYTFFFQWVQSRLWCDKNCTFPVCIMHNVILKWSLLCQSQQNSKRLSALWTNNAFLSVVVLVGLLQKQ